MVIHGKVMITNLDVTNLNVKLVIKYYSKLELIQLIGLHVHKKEKKLFLIQNIMERYIVQSMKIFVNHTQIIVMTIYAIRMVYVLTDFVNVHLAMVATNARLSAMQVVKNAMEQLVPNVVILVVYMDALDLPHQTVLLIPPLLQSPLIVKVILV